MSLKIQRYDLIKNGSVLATRPVGRTVGTEAASQLADSRGLLLSFHGVEVASPSFLTEVISALRGVLSSSQEHWLVLTGMNDDVRESVQLVLKHERMILGELSNGQIELLGGAEHLSETMREAQKLSAFTAPQLADRLKVKLPALHQRLNQLRDAGLLAVEDDPSATRGKRGKYTPPPTNELEAAANTENPELATLAGSC